MSNEKPLRTPLYPLHRALGAKMTPFGGWDMPVQYSGIIEEVRAVRQNAGVFDVSHMGRVWCSGEKAADFLQSVSSNDIYRLAISEGQYSLLTNETGGIEDDIILYRKDINTYLLVLNAGNKEKDIAWLKNHADKEVVLEDSSEALSMIAVQGPGAVGILSAILDHSLDSLPRFSLHSYDFDGDMTWLARTGYTGEDGFEVMLPPENAEHLWRLLIEKGALSCGLGARDTLRIEAGYPLYGHEINQNITPVDAGLMWAAPLDKGEFIGSRAIQLRMNMPIERKLVGIRLNDRVPPRQGYTLYSGDIAVGTVTSGTFSPTIGAGVGMAYVLRRYSKTGTSLELDIRGKRFAVTVTPKNRIITG
jgi:aminomethyltransferase